MKILGIHDAHNASICLFENGQIRFAIQEERLSKVKNQGGFPYQALEETLKRTNTRIKDIDYFVFAGEHSPRPVSKEEMLENYKKLAEGKFRIRRLLKHTPLYKLYRMQRKKERIKPLLKLGVSEEKIKFVEHHTCHAYTAYWGSPFRNKKVLVFTNDGEGDGICATVSIFDEKGNREVLQVIEARHSIGELYAITTFYLGMVPLEHEYKLMGMAPYAPESGMKKSYNVFRNIYEEIGEKGNFKINKSFPATMYLLPYLLEKLKFHRFDWISAGIQKLTEEILVNWIRYWVNETNIKTIALSGGVFMNVKANKLIMELPEIEEMFIFPSCGDETNSIGACYFVYEEIRKKNTNLPPIKPLGDFYLGGNFSNSEVEETLRRYKFKQKVKITYMDDIEKKVAELLAKNEVVARFKGRMEFGARALGNRSILANPQSWQTVNRINKMIKKRDFWMPFAPSIQVEYSNRYLKKPKPISAPYMILTFDTKEEKRDKMQAAIHPYDSTARPQEVYKEWNEDYWKLINYFGELTGEYVILNTSFNLHGYPIVYDPEDALFVLDNSGLKYLAIENFLVEKI
jgi:carbamoyltransferase